jgi:hypothetical protein
MILDIYTKGYAQGRTRPIRAGSDLMGAAPLCTNLADWLLMATLRDDANDLIDYAGDDSWIEGLAGATAWWAMQDWCREVLFMSSVAKETTIFYGEEDELLVASNAIAKGGVAFIMCSLGLLESDANSNPAVSPTHWVAMVGEVPGKPLVKHVKGLFSDDAFAVRVFSWGSLYDCCRDEEDFEDEVWGFVCATGEIE